MGVLPVPLPKPAAAVLAAHASIAAAGTPVKPTTVAPIAAAAGSGAVEASSACSGLRVLIAEDSLVLQRLYRRCFEKAGIQPVIVSDGQQALEACLGRGTQRYQQQRHLQQHPFDVVLMVR